MKKRITALFLSAIMCLNLLSVTAFAKVIEGAGEGYEAGDLVFVEVTDANGDKNFVQGVADGNGNVIIDDGFQPPAHTHFWSWTHDASEHWQVCSCGATQNRGAHTYVNNTCTVCGSAMPHTHSYSDAWSSDAGNHWHECSCGEKSDLDAHTSDGGRVTTEATAYQNGVRTYSCAVCGYVLRTEVIPATGGTYYPGGETGGGSVTTPVEPSYSVKNSSGGSVRGAWSVDKSSAKAGETVTIAVQPKENYRIGAVTVKDASGNEVSVTELGDGRYSFTMPDRAVTIDVTFTFTGETSAPSTTQPVNPFTDVKAGDYFYEAVLWAVEQGITNGTSAGRFSPGQTCTRAQTVTFLWRAAGSPTPAGSANPFTDVKAGDYFYDAVLWAVEQGITNGTSASKFSPDDTVTRGQTVTFMHRAAGSPAAGGSNPFTDVKAGDYYYNAVLWAVEQNITNGTSATAFAPDEGCTRGQIVTFLHRAN